MAASCVSLSKPFPVQECADKGNCSNSSTHKDGGTDLARDADASAPDRPADLTSESPAVDHDVAAEVGGDATDTRDAGEDVAGPDTADLRLGDEPATDLPAAEIGRETEPEPRAEPTPEPPPEPGRDGGEAGSGNCITRIIAGGYSYGSTPPCSACKDNSTPLQTKCEDMIDCLAPPSTKADMTRCLNQVAGSDPVNKCVTALITAACPSGF